MRNPSGFPRGFPVERQTQGKDWRCLTDSRLPHVSWHVSTIFSCSTHLAILSFWKCNFPIDPRVRMLVDLSVYLSAGLYDIFS